MKTIWIISLASSIQKYSTRLRTNFIAEQLALLGYDVHVFISSAVHKTNINIANKQDKRCAEIIENGVHYHAIKTVNYNKSRFFRLINIMQFILNFNYVSKKLSKPNIIVSSLPSIFAYYPAKFARKSKIPYIIEVRDLWPESIIAYSKFKKTNPLIRLLNIFEYKNYIVADAIIFSMEGGKVYVNDKNWNKKVDQNKIFHVNNGIDLDNFNFLKTKNIYSNYYLDNDDIFKVIYTGSIGRSNNLLPIIIAAKKIEEIYGKHIVFLIFGEGSEIYSLKEYCSINCISNVQFIGKVDRRFIPNILSKGNVNILHFDNNELLKYGVSLNKMFEYFASGKPIITDFTNDYDLIKRYRCGLSADKGTVDDLVNAIVKVKEMGAFEYNTLCGNSILAANDYDYKLLSIKYEKIILDVIKKRGKE